MHGNEFYIDKLTNSIENFEGKSFYTEVVPINTGDLKNVLKKHGWRFNWKSEFKFKEREVLKLVISGDSVIQGLICIQPMDNYIELHLIEAAPHNFGASKLYAGVAGNLVAFACKASFNLGFEGIVAFSAKTRLIKHYIDSLGAELIFRNRMIISDDSSKKLVNSYYKNYLQ